MGWTIIIKYVIYVFQLGNVLKINSTTIDGIELFVKNKSIHSIRLSLVINNIKNVKEYNYFILMM